MSRSQKTRAEGTESAISTEPKPNTVQWVSIKM